MTTARTAFVVLVLFVAAACTTSDTKAAEPASSGPQTTTTTATHATAPSAGCHVTPAVAPGSTDQTLESGGVERRYQLDVPPSYDGSKAFAIVLGLHALSIPYTFIPGVTGMTEMASKYDFIGVAPSGRLDGATPFWNALPVADNYDLAFIGDLLDHLESTLCVDTGRVFSMGQSNGAQMSALLACRLSGRITAIAAVAGVEFLGPCDGAPVPVLAFQGTADPIIPYAGGGLNATTIADNQFYKGNLPPGLPTPVGVDESMRLWAQHNGCDADFVEQRISAEVRERVWQHCKATTELYIVDGGGHSWPGKPFPQFEAQFGHTTTDIDATTLIFTLFFGG